jgi:hypothetical protein
MATAGVIAAAALVPAPAQASNSGAIVGAAGGGLAVGTFLGATWQPYPYGYAYAPAPAPVYYGGPYAYSRCQMVRQKIVTDYGPRWRRVRVCD